MIVTLAGPSLASEDKFIFQSRGALDFASISNLNGFDDGGFASSTDGSLNGWVDVDLRLNPFRSGGLVIDFGLESEWIEQEEDSNFDAERAGGRAYVSWNPPMLSGKFAVGTMYEYERWRVGGSRFSESNVYTVAAAYYFRQSQRCDFDRLTAFYSRENLNDFEAVFDPALNLSSDDTFEVISLQGTIYGDLNKEKPCDDTDIFRTVRSLTLRRYDITLRHIDHPTVGAEFHHSALGAAFRADLPLKALYAFDITASYDRVDYDNPSIYSDQGLIREDDRYYLDLGWTYSIDRVRLLRRYYRSTVEKDADRQAALGGELDAPVNRTQWETRVRIGVSKVWNDSNVGIFDYDQLVVGARLQWVWGQNIVTGDDTIKTPSPGSDVDDGAGDTRDSGPVIRENLPDPEEERERDPL